MTELSQNLFWYYCITNPLYHCLHCSHLFTHHRPVPILDTRVTQGIDQWHVDLELLKLAFDGGCCPHGPPVIWVGKQFGELVGCPPQLLYLFLYLW